MPRRSSGPTRLLRRVSPVRPESPAARALDLELVAAYEPRMLPDYPERLARAAAESGRALRVLVQVDLAGEATKSGLPEADLTEALRRMGGLEGLQVTGLMALPPYLGPEEVRPYFRRLRILRDGETLDAILRPARWADVRQRIYDADVRSNRARVEQRSGGRVGYVHIQGMGRREVELFERDLYAAAHGRDALVIDVLAGD